MLQAALVLRRHDLQARSCSVVSTTVVSTTVVSSTVVSTTRRRIDLQPGCAHLQQDVIVIGPAHRSLSHSVTHF